MVDCARCREALSARHDGSATDLDEVVLRGHLRSCSACGAYESDLVRLDALAQGAVEAVAGDRSVGRPLVLPDLAELVARVGLGLVAVFHILRCLTDLRAGLPASGMHGAEGAIWGLSFAGLLLVATIRPRTAPVVAGFAAIQLTVMALTRHDALPSHIGHIGIGGPTVSGWLGAHSLDLIALACLLAVTWRISRHSWRALL